MIKISQCDLEELEKFVGSYVGFDRVGYDRLLPDEGLLTDVFPEGVCTEFGWYPFRGRFEGIRKILLDGEPIYTDNAFPTQSNGLYKPQFD
jgi:hypothetical protein